MLNLIIFGPPGAGKGTQAVKVAEKYELVHLSTGDIFRSNLKNGTALGTLAKSYMDKGALVPDEVTIKMLESEVNKNSAANGFIFDGFPRTLAQADALDNFFAKKKLSINMTLSLEVDDEELVKRILIRGSHSGRADDQNESIVRNRIKEYNNKTAPLKAYYTKQGKFVSIDGMGNIEQTFEKLRREID